MPSKALIEWQSSGLPRLNELEQVHADATGHGPGRRWGTTQLNRSLFVALVAQFQTYCRDLHDEAVSVHVAHANEHQARMLGTLLTQGRKLAHQTPRTDALGSDFGRLGLTIVDAVKAAHADGGRSLELLDVLVDFRNAVVYGNETSIAALVAAGEIKTTKRDYRRYRRLLEHLTGTMDQVVAVELSDALHISPPW